MYLGVERAHIVGHSFGGAIALQLAMDVPDMVHSLALLEPALIAGESAAGYRDSLTRNIERYRELGAAVVLDEFLRARWPDYRTALEQSLPGAFDLAVTDAKTSFEGELPALLDWLFGEAEASHINQPTLSVLGGESDAHWPRFGETHRLLLAWLPNAEGFVVPVATHFMQLQNPWGVAQALANFWARHRILSDAD